MDKLFAVLVLVSLIFQSCEKELKYRIEGRNICRQPLNITFYGPKTDEALADNPFLNFRLNVLFINGNDSVIVPGYFAADGNAAETGAISGNKWKVKFTPNKTGTWKFETSFRYGENVAVADDPDAGVPGELDGLKGEFNIYEADLSAPGFYGKGRLQYSGKHYLHHAQTGEIFLKGGTDSPENFLAYADFDNTLPHHRYASHVADWKAGDPVWQNDKGKGIIGALNYLAGEKMNVVYMLTMNVLGDGDDVYPWTNRNERYRFDCSKLDQWDLVFDHMDRLGIETHFVLSENENQLLLDAGFTDVQRKLYYRELVARFSHHLGVVWNMGEENGPAPWFDSLGQTVKQRQTMAAYLRKIDPYKNLIVFHTLPSRPELKDYSEPMLGKDYVDGISLQIGNVNEIHEKVKYWVNRSTETGRPWVVNMDEIGPWYSGVLPDALDANHDTTRVHALWGSLMAGGAGVEWYCGREDLKLDDFRSRANMWEQTRAALDFFKKLPLNEMKSADELILKGSAWCFAKADQIYVVYLAEGGTAELNMKGAKGSYAVTWINPAKGERMDGSSVLMEAGSKLSLVKPSALKSIDALALLTKVE
ncbi:MAG: DUF5060 domain-containing protein [Prolixibacteraceae bacterium]